MSGHDCRSVGQPFGHSKKKKGGGKCNVRCYSYYREKQTIYCSEGSYKVPARPAAKVG